MSMDKRQKDAAGRLRRGERVQIQITEDAAGEVIEEASKQRRPISQMLRFIIEEWADARRKTHE